MTFQAIKTSMMKFVKDEDGLTVVEYAIAGGLVALGVAAAFTALGAAVDVTIGDLAACLGDTTQGGTCPT